MTTLTITDIEKVVTDFVETPQQTRSVTTNVKHQVHSSTLDWIRSTCSQWVSEDCSRSTRFKTHPFQELHPSCCSASAAELGAVSPRGRNAKEKVMRTRNLWLEWEGANWSCRLWNAVWTMILNTHPRSYVARVDWWMWIYWEISFEILDSTLWAYEWEWIAVC